jgi:7-keto-8-aminopelargonate synthetase-like enzyme
MRYKFRLILDEAWSFGVLGQTGRGVTESQRVDTSQVDILVGSLAGPLSAGGGFCAGSHDVVDHQRLSATSYTYSCGLPAMLARTAGETISMLQADPEILTTCRKNITMMRTQLAKCHQVNSISSPENPVQLLVLKSNIVESQNLRASEQEQIFQDCVDEVHLSTPGYPVF